MWHFIRAHSVEMELLPGGRVVWAVSKHLRPIPSPIVENSLRNRHLNLKNEKSEKFQNFEKLQF